MKNILYNAFAITLVMLCYACSAGHALPSKQSLQGEKNLEATAGSIFFDESQLPF